MLPVIDDAAIRGALARQSLQDYCGLIDPQYLSSAHTRKVCEYLEALERRDIQKLMIWMPPRHSKTYHCTRMFTSWYLGRHPSDQVILASYAAELSNGNSRFIRDTMEHEAYPFAVRPHPEARAMHLWNTTEGGVVRAAGASTGIGGFGAHLLNLDDPFADREEAESRTIRDVRWNWYTDVFVRRRMPGAIELQTTTRWNTDDISGRILAGPTAAEWEVLRLPMECEDPETDPLGRALGEVLWPEFFTQAEWEKDKRLMSERTILSLYQQRPTQEGGNIIKQAWWSAYHRLPRGLSYRIFVDAAFATGVRNDPSAVCTWGTTGVNHYAAHVINRKMEFPDLEAAVIGEWQRVRNEHRAHALIVIENQASGISLYQALRQKGYPAVLWPRPDDPDPEYRRLRQAKKISRLERVIGPVRMGNCYLPQDENGDWLPWVQAFVEQHAAFDGSGVTHDDMVDCTTMMLWEFTHRFWSDLPRAQPYKRELRLVGGTSW